MSHQTRPIKPHGNKIYLNPTNSLIVMDDEKELRAAVQKITTMNFDSYKIHKESVKYNHESLFKRAFKELCMLKF